MLHRGDQGIEVVRRVQQAGAGVVDDVERAAGRRGHDRDAARHRLLQRLPERLVGAGVHEHVERRVRAGQVLAVQAAEDAGAAARERVGDRGA